MTKKSTHDRRDDPKHAVVPAHDHGHGHGHGHEHEHAHEEELIHVPKGQSKARFYFMIFLTIFVGVMFVVSDAFFMSATGSAQRDVVYASWTRPDGSRHELSGTDFFNEKRSLRFVQDFAGLFGLVGTEPGEPFDAGEDFDAARFLIMEEAATAAGIRISDQDLGKAIEGLIGMYFQTREGYRGWLASRNVTPAVFEATFRRLLLVQRFRTFLAAAAYGVAPTEIEQAWKANHQEFAFDYVQVPTANFDEAARMEVPDDAALEAWFNALSPFQKAEYDTQLKWSADLAYVPLADGEESSFDATLLLEKFPRPADEDPAAKALDYYERVKFTRFLRDTPLEGVEGPEGRVLPFDEVEAICLREAPVYYSFEEWHRGLNQRLADGSLVSEVDLAAEAAALGLEFVPAGPPRTMTEWNEDADVPYAGTRLPSSLRGLQVGRLTPVAVIEKRALVVGLQVERLEPGPPPFAEIRDRVADAWVEERRSELALASLEKVRDLLGARPAEPTPDPATGVTPEPEEFLPVVDAATFEKACADSSLEVRRRDFQERKFTQRAPAPEDEAPVEPVLQFNPTLYSLEEGAVPAPLPGRDGESAFLFRFAGQRDASPERMKPLEYLRERQTLASTAVTDFFARTYDSRDYLRERYGLFLYEATEEELESEPGS